MGSQRWIPHPRHVLSFPACCRSCVIMQTRFGNRSCAGEPWFHEYRSFLGLPHLQLIRISVAALCMGIGPDQLQLWGCQCWEHRTYPHIHGDYRHHFTSHHGLWLASPAPSRWWHFWSDPTPLETGLMTLFSDTGYLAYGYVFP